MRDWRRPGLLAGTLALGACQAFAPTIPQRMERGPDRDQVPVSLQEEYPKLLDPAPEPAPEGGPRGVHDTPAFEPPSIGGDELVTVEFRGANLSQVVQFIAEQASINILLDPYLDRQVDVSFPSVTMDAALHAVLEEHGMRLVERAEGIYAIELNDGSQPAMASFEVHSIDVGELTESLTSLTSGSSQVIVEPSQNLVVVRGTQGDVDAVRDYLGVADRLKRQVLIEARILEVSLTETFDLGVSAAINGGTIDGDVVDIVQSLASPDDSFEVLFQSESGKVDAAIQAIRELTGVDLVSSPRILAMTGTEAKIAVIREVPYINVTNTTVSDPGTGAGTNVVEEVQLKEAGITMTVTPTIMNGGAIQISVTTQFSEVVGEFQQIPVVDERMLTSNFLVRDRHTVVMGGLMQNKRTEIDKGIPGLMNIPLLGRLFRSDGDELQKREMLVFLTPRIVDDDEAGRLTEVFRGVYTERIREDGVRAVED